MSSLPSMRDLLKDERVGLVKGRVETHEGEPSHFEITAEGHVSLQCKSQIHGVPITAIMPGGSDDGSGTWAIPAPGTEVLLGFDDGDFEGDAFVVQVFGNAPPAVAATKVFIQGTDVRVQAPGGTAVSLATKADLQADVDYLKNQFHATLGHVHVVAGAATTTITEGTGGPGTSGTAPSPSGTSILRGQ